MNEKVRCITFLFNGTEVSSGLVKDLAGMIGQACHVENGEIAVSVLDANEMAKLPGAVIMLKTVEQVKDIINKHVVEDITPEDAAVIFIGTAMRDTLKRNPTNEEFMGKLVARMIVARQSPEMEESRQFMNAMFVLSQEDLRISKQLLREYNLSPRRIRIIKDVYRTLSHE